LQCRLSIAGFILLLYFLVGLAKFYLILLIDEFYIYANTKKTYIRQDAIPKSHRYDLVDIVIGRLKDKTSLVRKNAIKLLTTIIDHHPFLADGRSLNLNVFMAKRDELDLSLKVSYTNQKKKRM